MVSILRIKFVKKRSTTNDSTSSVPTDPYNAYYKQKVRDFQEGKVETSLAAPKPQLPEAVKDAVKKADFVPTKTTSSVRILCRSSYNQRL
ncbi:hypothetical protein KIN20_001901 [Parelaphostrongylus tenuis]|uniref:Uncharacterized protein n=1 Tax=Parelaphostrongylus tenuis TaxID=148309 RepID=A0AAD5MG07_PARTN|nr:hypothetical protein KIN20_001901 [Parelaphostrongylus tenuis]